MQRVEPVTADFRHCKAQPCQAGLQHCVAHALCANPANHRTWSTRFLQQDGGPCPTAACRALRCALDTCSPCSARSCCQPLVPLNGRADAGRGHEPAARVQPCAAITVLLIPRGFRMSEPDAPCRGQLCQGELPSLPTLCTCPSALCFSSPLGKAIFSLLRDSTEKPQALSEALPAFL